MPSARVPGSCFVPILIFTAYLSVVSAHQIAMTSWGGCAEEVRGPREIGLARSWHPPRIVMATTDGDVEKLYSGPLGRDPVCPSSFSTLPHTCLSVCADL